MNITLRKIIFVSCILFCLLPFMDAPFALLLGFFFSQLIEHPFKKQNSKVLKYLLQISIVGLGFGMNLNTAFEAGKEGLVFTIISIATTLLLGFALGKLFGLDKKVTVLLSSGTAICGGSAIAAVGPVIEAEDSQMSIALGAVFILNSVALFLFPWIGHLLNLNQHQFGLWAAIAIHDTSSVVGAAHQFGDEALSIATTVKLERALWIIPLTLIFSNVFKSNKGKVNVPLFILFYVAAMAINTYLPSTQIATSLITLIARKGLIITLFLVGAGLSRDALRKVGAKPFVAAVLLWIFISVMSLLVITHTA